MDFTSSLASIRETVDRRLAELAPPSHGDPASLHGAMRYTLLAPGKRVRGIMAILAAESFGAAASSALDPACALEMVHAASLILDDLPSMDDGLLRRGRPTCHQVFGEDIAVLAAFGLLNRAYAVLAEAPGIEPDIRLDLVRMLARVIGEDGMIAGQVLDLRHGKGTATDVSAIERVASGKTGTLFVACAETGARLARVRPEVLEFARSFARNLGLYFQTMDDVVDRDGSAAVEGKNLGQDAGKTTFATTLGGVPASERAERYLASAHEALGALGENAAPLRHLGRYLLETGKSRTVRR